MEVRVDVGPAGVLVGELDGPAAAAGLVVFAHGSGSSRHSPRNQAVASVLRDNGLATVLVDLLTPEEERRDRADAALRFDIELLADRVGRVVDACPQWPAAEGLPVGLFGASTGAAAALVAAARRPHVRSVVSRGGRPDLAADSLRHVHVPVLLLVGGLDTEVLRLNERAAGSLAGDADISVVPGASHLFEETGALEVVSSRAAAFFRRTLTGGA